jgi:hypothetical protein
MVSVFLMVNWESWWNILLYSYLAQSRTIIDTAICGRKRRTDSARYRPDQYGLHFGDLSGHEHNLQYIKPSGYTKYFVSGAGSETTPVIVHPDGGVFAKSENGFMNISLTPDQMEVNVISYMGESLYKTVIQHN